MASRHSQANGRATWASTLDFAKERTHILYGKVFLPLQVLPDGETFRIQRDPRRETMLLEPWRKGTSQNCTGWTMPRNDGGNDEFLCI
jgi:hypothetical protein